LRSALASADLYSKYDKRTPAIPLQAVAPFEHYKIRMTAQDHSLFLSFVA